MSRTLSSAIVLLALLAPSAGAEEAAPKAVKAPGAPLRLQVVLSRYHGEKKVGSLPYTLMGSANGESMAMASGIMVPVRYEGKDYTGNVVYKSVGSNLDCTADTLDGGRFKVACKIESSSIYTDVPAGTVRLGDANPPVLNQLKAQAVLLLRDGQAAEYASATDPVSGDVLKVDMTLNVLK